MRPTTLAAQINELQTRLDALKAQFEQEKNNFDPKPGDLIEVNDWSEDADDEYWTVVVFKEFDSNNIPVTKDELGYIYARPLQNKLILQFKPIPKEGLPPAEDPHFYLLLREDQTTVATMSPSLHIRLTDNDVIGYRRMRRKGK